MTKQVVAEAIAKAFDGTLPPSADSLVCPPHDRKQWDIDRTELYNLLLGKTWPQLVGEFKGMTAQQFRHYSMFNYLATPESFIYYLPAFMIRCLDGDGDVFADHLLERLDIVHEAGYVYYGDATVPSTLEQRRAIEEFVNFLGYDGRPRNATNR